MNYKITLELTVSMTPESKEFYDENPADLHESLAVSDNAKITVVETTEPAQESWN